MNRRHFIKTILTTSAVLPSLPLISVKKSEWNERDSYRVLEHSYELLTPDDLSKNKIRNDYHPASVVDKNGVFGHEHGCCEPNEPFIAKAFRIKCLPKIYSTDKKDLLPIIGKIKSGNNWTGCYTIDNVISEVKEDMELVCFVGYVQTENEYNERFYIPIMRGLSKYRYNLYLKQMNS
jgi:hypothetical protein